MYYFLKYTDDIPEGFAGEAKFWFIKIRPAYKSDLGLLDHEKVHVDQFWRTWGLHILLRRYQPYHSKCEVEAYKRQLQYNSSQILKFANRLSIMYGFNLTKQEALKLLS